MKIEDLQDGSNVKIQYLCDYCHENVITMVYADFIRRTKETKKMACSNCKYIKVKENNDIKRRDILDKTLQEDKEDEKLLLSSTEKRHNTCVKKYGESYRKHFIEKAFKTFHERTGYNYPSQSPEVREKIIQSCVDHYGVTNPQHASDVKKRTELTNLDRYGCKRPLQSQEIREKCQKTMYENNTCTTSKQQFYIYSLYKIIDDSTKINYPISKYFADICLLKDKIDIEVDFGGHNLAVKMGYETQEEFDRKEMIRNLVIRKEGYRQMRIISYTDKLPQDEILLQMLEYTKEYFSTYTQHSWIEFNIDSSTVRNAEQKEGVFFDYGKLRRIKKSDFPDDTIDYENPNGINCA